ncbi:MAG: NAD-dependent epimerase/dehydratase family protein [Thermoplasmata archaeon]
MFSFLHLVHVAVTGANGFIGRNLVKALLEEGHHVLSIVRRVEKAPMLRALGSEVRVMQLNQRERLAACIKSNDTLFHLANVMVFATTREQLRANVLNTRHVLWAAVTAGAHRLVYTSSVAVYGDTKGAWATEENPRNPITHYGRTKVQVEDLIGEKASGMNWHILRLGVVYEPGSPFLYHTARRGPVLLNDGSNWVPLLHVRDVVAALMETAVRDRSGSILNVVDDRPLRLHHFLGIVAREAGVSLRHSSYAAAFLMALAAEAAANVRGRAPPLTRDVLRLPRTSIRVSNRRIKEDLAFHLRHPDPESSLPQAMRRVSETFAL